MLELKNVIRNKSTEGLPFPIIFVGFLVSSAWLTYGIVLNSIFMVLQNVVAVLLGGFQLSFFLIYPSKKATVDKKKKKKN
jgi:solute carrier family 50 (sugar transporter)